MFLQAEKSTPGQREEAAAALRAEENIKAQLRGDSFRNMKQSLSRGLSMRNMASRSSESEETLDALLFQEQMNENLQERLTGLMDMVESQSECIRGLEATATQANARIRELESQVKDAGGMVRERVRTGGLVKIREGAVSADGRYDIGARRGDGSLGEAGGRGSAPGSPHRRRRSSGSRRRVASSVASGSSAQTV